MPSVSGNISRAPNLLWSQLLLGNLTRTNLGILDVQSQMATGKRVNRFSDDSISAGAISVLDDRLARGGQRLQNLSQAGGTLGFLDSSLGDASELVLEAKSIASDQIGVTSDTTTRSTQAVVIDGMIRTLYQLANRQTNGLYVFGGSTPTRQPIEEMRGGFRYVGRGSGMFADLDGWDDIPVTIGGDNAIGEISARLRSTADLSPALTPATRLADTAGARGLGVRLGEIAFSFDGGPTATVDLADADTAQSVIDRLTAAIRQYETDNGLTVLGPGGIGVSGSGFSIDVAPGGPPAPQLVFSDVGSGVTAQDLGLAAAPFDSGAPAGQSIAPRLTKLTPLAAVPGLTLPLGSIRVRFGSGSAASFTDVDLSSAQTIGDVQSLIQSNVPGARVEINATGSGIDVFNEVSGPAMAIEEVPGGAATATQLGIRSLSAKTAITDFNHGRGVRVVDNQIDAQTGTATRAQNVDFRVTLGNGQAFEVDLRPQDLASVQTVIDRINQEFADALLQPPLVGTAPPLAPGDFTAGLSDGANGIAFVQGVAGGAIAVEQKNNSAAAEDLGLLTGAYDSGSATLIAQDRATVRVNNLFSALIDLRDALRDDDSAGITVAGEALEAGLDRVAGARALVGVHASRLDRAARRQEDAMVLDEKVQSELQHLDFAEASIRFGLLQTQLQAALASGAQAQSLSLLDYLG